MATSLCDCTAEYLLNSFWCVHCPEGITRPHSHSLINVKSLHTGCQRAVGGAADEVAPTFAALWRDALSVSVTYTALWPITLTPCGGYVGILVCVCVYIPVGD